MVDEAERSLHDALAVLSQTVKETRVVLGGGCSEMLMSNAVDEAARKTSGKKAIAVEAFARALRQVRFAVVNGAIVLIDFHHVDTSYFGRQRWT
jgi:T-complex protein 1 subunit beta